MAETLRFDDYARDRFARLKQSLGAKGIQLDGDSGEIRRFGAEVAWSYAGNRLDVVIAKPPHFHSLAGFAAELDKAIEAQA